MKTVAALLPLMFVLLLTACNTMRGAGEDIQKAGSAIENAAKKK
jgi:predicted small secreted protein